MAMNMDAMLRIAARATGGEQVEALGRKIHQVEGVTSRLTKATGLLGPALGALAPVATIGGLGALVKTQIEAAGNFNDLSQRTGVSVEALARFNKAAKVSGTDIEAVSKNLSRLSKGMYEAAQTGKGPTAEALATLGISAKDAAGNLKSADQVTLEIANRFKTMPDGAQKTAIAMQLFGRAGADMIPMLNMGGDAIDNLSVKMTKAFAEKADQYNDKLTALSGKVGGLAAGLTIALLPALELIVDGMTSVIDMFGKLPGPIQAIIGGLALLALAFTALALPLVGVVSGLKLLAGLQIGATIAGWLGALGPLLTGLKLFAAFLVSWPVLIGVALVAAGVLIYRFRDQIGDAIKAVGKFVYDGISSFSKAIQDGISIVWNWLGERFTAMQGMIRGLYDGAVSLFGRIGDAIKAPFQAAVDWIRRALNNVLSAAGNAVNGFIQGVNQLIAGVNQAAAAVRLPQIPGIPTISIPQFAGGGYTGNAPRSGGLDGRGGFMAMLHPRETVIDHGRGGTGAAPSITIKTGPVMQQPDGSQWVSLGDLQTAMQATAAAVMGTLRTPGARVALRGA